MLQPQQEGDAKSSADQNNDITWQRNRGPRDAIIDIVSAARQHFIGLLARSVFSAEVEVAILSTLVKFFVC